MAQLLRAPKFFSLLLARASLVRLFPRILPLLHHVLQVRMLAINSSCQRQARAQLLRAPKVVSLLLARDSLVRFVSPCALPYARAIPAPGTSLSKHPAWQPVQSLSNLHPTSCVLPSPC